MIKAQSKKSETENSGSSGGRTIIRPKVVSMIKVDSPNKLQHLDLDASDTLHFPEVGRNPFDYGHDNFGFIGSIPSILMRDVS